VASKHLCGDPGNILIALKATLNVGRRVIRFTDACMPGAHKQPR
jgi:hypothetical protein